jgi:hypothetical protein
MHTPESHRRRNTQRAGKTATALRHVRHGLFDIAHDPPVGHYWPRSGYSKLPPIEEALEGGSAFVGCLRELP